MHEKIKEIRDSLKASAYGHAAELLEEVLKEAELEQLANETAREAMG